MIVLVGGLDIVAAQMARDSYSRLFTGIGGFRDARDLR